MKCNLKYRADIQALRALAVVAVIMFHSKENWFPQGYLGVDIFFVISGFVVTPLIMRIFYAGENTGHSVRQGLYNFYRRRFYRLAPALAGCIVFTTFLVLIFGTVSDHGRFVSQAISTLLLGGNFGALHFSGNYFSPAPNPLIHTWSLSAEEQIYLFLPLIFALLYSWKRLQEKNVWKIFIIIIFLSLLFHLSPSLGLVGWKENSFGINTDYVFYSSFARIWQFLIGGLTFILLNQKSMKNIKGVRLFQHLSALILLFLLFIPLELSVDLASLLISIVTCSAIFFHSFEIKSQQMSHAFQWLGDRSYSLYLFHMPLLYIAKYPPTFLRFFDERFNRILQTGIALIFTLLLAILSYRYVESRFRISDNSKVAPRIESKVFIGTFVFPMALLLIMNFGLSKNYWGLDRNPTPPLYASALDKDCDRESENGPPCIYTNGPTDKTVLLLGDSHGGQFSQAVVDAGLSLNFRVVLWTHSGCEVQFVRSSRMIIPDYCYEASLEMRDWVKLNRPSAIIVSQYIDNGSSMKDLKEALLQLKGFVPNLAVVSNTLIFPDGKDFFVSRPLIRTPYQAPKIFSESQMVHLHDSANAEIMEFSKSQGIYVIDVNANYCDGIVCRRWSPEGWLFSDADHLSAVGASLAIPQFMDFLSRIR